MKYLLEQVEQLVCETIVPEKILVSAPPENLLQEWQHIALSEKELIKRKFISEVFLLEKPKRVRLFVETNQEVLIRLANTSIGYSRICKEKYSGGLRDSLADFYFSLSDHLCDLLVFLQRNFGKYFNEELPVPEVFKNAAILEISTQLIGLRKAGTARLCETELLDIALLAAERFIRENRSITFRELYYLKMLHFQLEQLFAKDPGEEINQLLTDLLVSANYNHPEFIRWLSNRLESQLSELPAGELRLKELQTKFRASHHLYTRPGISLFPAMDSVRQQMLVWMENEIYLAELNIQAAGHLLQEAFPATGKLGFSVSVAVLGLLIKLLVTEGIITNPNHSEIIRFFARNCRTSRQEAISFESLYNKYHQVNLGTVNITREILRRLTRLNDTIG